MNLKYIDLQTPTTDPELSSVTLEICSFSTSTTKTIQFPPAKLTLVKWRLTGKIVFYRPQEYWNDFKNLMSLPKPGDKQGSPDFPRLHTEFLQSLNPEIDIFTFGALLLYMVNNGKTWKSGADLRPKKIERLVRDHDFFEPEIYDRIKRLIRRCFMSADYDQLDAGFAGFHEILKTIEQEFGFIVKKIDAVHTQPQRLDSNPSNDFPITQFRTNVASFYNEFYFGNVEGALKNFEQAKKLRTQLGKDNTTMLDSFTFNDLMLQWIQGKISATHAIENSQKWLSIQLLAHTNTYKNLHQAIKLLPTVHDSKFITYFERTFANLVEHYVYKDFNKKTTLLNSADKCNVSHVLVSAESNTFVLAMFKTGVNVYTLDRELRSSYKLEGITALAGGDDLSSIIVGTNHGIVYTFPILKGTGRIEEKNIRQLYRHEGKVKQAAMSLQGNIAMSFGKF